jgi:type VI secretion system secreted protein VgrG
MSVQSGWPITLTTPLGDDVLIPEGFTASEGVSRMFEVKLDAITEHPHSVDFDRLLGQSVTLELKIQGAAPRVWNGIVSRIVQGNRTTDFTAYTVEMVPRLWLLTRASRSRIFQRKTVPDIIKEVLANVDFSLEVTTTFLPRNYCVQYRETDFHFVSRLMEEEGIFYFFRHSPGRHEMAIVNSPAAHADMPGNSSLTYDEVRGGARKDHRIYAWQKSQEIRSGKVTLWDHSFELPHKHLDADKTMQESVSVGGKSMKLKVPVSAALELYDYPGGYAERFDGITAGGADAASNLQNIFDDNKRTAEIRMQAETARELLFFAESDCRQIVSGYKFGLERHFSDSGNAKDYIVLAAEHSASHPLGTERSPEAFKYSNRFTSLPLGIPFRPPRITPLPAVRGTQTAVVVGPSGEEIFTDKYGRVKVQFHWDRDGTDDANSSCWLRVATPWAGKQWGSIHIPRVGQEVLVDFLEGDPDRPIIVGSVYNADQLPPYVLPANKTQSGIKSRSSKDGGADNFNELRFEDRKGKEQIYTHAEKDMLTEVENDETRDVGHDRTTTVKNNETRTVKEGNDAVTIGQGNQTLEIKMGNQTIAIKMGNQSTKLDAGKSETEAMQSIELKVGQSSVKLDQTGVTIKGMTIKIEGQIQVQIKGLMTQVNGDAMLTAKGGIVMIN